MVVRHRDRWCATWTDAHGKRRWQYFPPGATKSHAREFELAKRLERIDPSINLKVETVASYIPQYFETYKRIAPREDSTLRAVRQAIKYRILPHFADRRLTEVTGAEVTDWQFGLYDHGNGLGLQTVKNARGVLSTIFEAAVLDRLVNGNPVKAAARLVPSAADRARRNRQSGDARFWTFSEADQFLCYASKADPLSFEAAAFALNTGLRPGEIMALQRRDIDFDQGLVHVRRIWCSTANALRDRTKTKRERKVSLNPQLLEVISPKFGLEPEAMLLPGAIRDFCHLRLKPLARAAGVPEIRFHDLRHTFASHLVMHGRTLEEVGAILGHTKAESTKIYAHFATDHLRGTTDILAHGMRWASNLSANLVPIRRI